MITLDDPCDPYGDDPPRCAIHGTEMDGDYCEACWLAQYQENLPFDAGEAEDERDERIRDAQD